MDMKTIKILFLLSATGSFLGLFPSDLSSLLTGQVKKSCYLAFHAPPKLQFHEVPVVANRTNLLMLGEPVSLETDDIASEGNETTELTEFPLTSYGEELEEVESEEESNSIEFLPPTDPFSDYEIGGSSIDSTDQLIQMFENLERSGNAASRVSVNFTPPYSTDSGNFKIESRANYTRRTRK
jgi:hypothetical protein